MSSLDKGVIKRESVEAMVAAYKRASSLVDQAFELMSEATRLMKSAYGENYSSFDILYQLHYSQTPKEIKAHLKKEAWKSLLDRIEVKKYMSNADIAKLEKSFDDVKNIPDIETSTLWEIINGLLNTTPEYAKKMALEAFKLLTPGRLEHNHYKTNKANSRHGVGKKVIFTWFYVTTSYGNLWHVNYSNENNLACIDKVFHVLDGKGVPKGYVTPLIDAINTTPINVAKGETEYFKFWCYRNGNLHLEFKRPDLVQKLNQIAGETSTLSD